MAHQPASADHVDRLPTADDWDGPIFGELGALETDGEKVACHACGRYFKNLATHVLRAHDLSPDAYRAIFGLNRGTGLIGPTLKARRADLARRLFTPYWPQAPEHARGLTPEQLRAAGGAPRRLETLRNPRNRQQWRALADTGRAAFRQRLAEDAAFRASFAQRVSEARGGRTAVTCVTCGTSFVSSTRKRQAKVCSAACDRERRSRLGRTSGVQRRPEVRARLRQRARQQWADPSARERHRHGVRKALQGSARFRLLREQLTVLDPIRWQAVPESRQEVVRRYYGLMGRQPATMSDIAAELRLSLRRAWQLLWEAEVALLGDLAAHERAVPGATRRRRPQAEQLRALTPPQLMRLGARDREIVERYYGLVDGRPWTDEELAGHFGVSARRIQLLRHRSVERLLGGEDAWPTVVERVPAACQVCGMRFEVPPSAVNRGTHRFCGAACIRRWELARRRGPKGFTFAEAAARLAAVKTGDWAALPDQVRAVVRLYYGLEDGTPRTQRAIGERFGLGPARVRNLATGAAVRRLMAAAGAVRDP